MQLWSKEVEREFFNEYLMSIPPEDLFYKLDDGRYCAYYPKDYAGTKKTLQARNSRIGTFTETWCNSLFRPIVEKHRLHAVRGAICEKIGLADTSPADLAVCTTNDTIQEPGNIKLIIEIKMSVVWNWEFKNKSIKEIGDYSTHIGNPGLLRSDSMLKAIGKSINIRVSDIESAKIPIIVLGNTPITDAYQHKVDFLKTSGVIQGFWSINPNPLNNKNTILKTTKEGFKQITNIGQLEQMTIELLEQNNMFFSGMKNLTELGKIIELASREPNYEQKANSFLNQIRNDSD